MSFKSYIAQRRITDTPAGDFVADARADRTFPDAKTWDEVRSYLRQRGACGDAVKAAHSVWRQYERSEGRPSRRVVEIATRLLAP